MTKPQHKVSWRHPHSKHWHQLDLILTRRSALKNVTITRSYQSSDCDTDHSLVCCKIKLQPKKFHHARQPGKPKIDTTKMSQQNLIEQFSAVFEEKVSAMKHTETATERWTDLCNIMHDTALTTFGRKMAKSEDWFDAKASEMTPVIEAKRRALAEDKAKPSAETKQALKAARSQVQQTARRCANEYWIHLSEEIQLASLTGNIRGMYEGIKKAFGPTQSKTAP